MTCIIYDNNLLGVRPQRGLEQLDPASLVCIARVSDEGRSSPARHGRPSLFPPNAIDMTRPWQEPVALGAAVAAWFIVLWGILG